MNFSQFSFLYQISYMFFPSTPGLISLTKQFKGVDPYLGESVVEQPLSQIHSYRSSTVPSALAISSVRSLSHGRRKEGTGVKVNSVGVTSLRTFFPRR